MAHNMTAERRGMLNRNHVRKELTAPARKAAEAQFAREHANDTDEELYALLKDMKRRQGKDLKPVRTIGLTYFEKRLGPWPEVMSRINRELEAEQAETLGITAAEWELLYTMRRISSGSVTVTVKKGEIKAIRTQEPPRAETAPAALAAP